MVHVEKDYANPPADLMDSKWNDHKSNVLVEKNTHNAKVECYRNTTLEKLVRLYKNKCACCERSRGEELQVDHYRPKKARNNRNATYNHPGYYWLTYDWSNLIPLCSSCNQSKSNYFPLKDDSKRISSHMHQHAYNPATLYTHEQPLFINPEIESKPEKHFKYLPNGKVEGRTEEGTAMVKFYKLNGRTKIRDRKSIIEGYVKKIRGAINEYLRSTSEKKEAHLRGDLKGTFREILNNGAKTRPLSLMHLFIRNYFKEFIANQFPVEWQDRLINNFNSYYHNIWKKG